jgi:hypothetical protein
VPSRCDRCCLEFRRQVDGGTGSTSRAPFPALTIPASRPKAKTAGVYKGRPASIDAARVKPMRLETIESRGPSVRLGVMIIARRPTGLLCPAGAVGQLGGAATGSQPVLGCDTRD